MENPTPPCSSTSLTKVTDITQTNQSPEELLCPLQKHQCSSSDTYNELFHGYCSPRSSMSHFDACPLMNAVVVVAASPESASPKTPSCGEEGRAWMSLQQPRASQRLPGPSCCHKRAQWQRRLVRPLVMLGSHVSHANTCVSTTRRRLCLSCQ